ncbi:MAG: lipoprotein [Xanthobacter sp.]
MPRLSLSFALFMTLAVAACGVKGPLELPPNAQNAPGASGAQASAQGQTAAGGTASSAESGTPKRETWAGQQSSLNQSGGSSAGTSFGWGQSNRQAEEDHLKGAEAPNRPFFLDWLL